MTRGERAGVLISVLYIAVCAGVFVVSQRAPGHRAVGYITVHATLTVLMWLGWRASQNQSQWLPWVMCLSGTVARWMLVPVTTFTTTDVGRYLWDGAVTLSGKDPYALAPRALELVPLSRVFTLPLDHGDVATCYPPLALGVFALAAQNGPITGVLVWKSIVALASTVTVFLAWWASREEPWQRHLALISLSPLLVLEGGVGAHLDVLMAPFMVGAIALAQREKHHGAALCVGVIAALKWVPAVMFLPVWLSAKRKGWWAALALTPLVLTHAVAEWLGMTPPGSLPVMAEQWNFSAPLWSVLYKIFPFDDEVIRTGLALGGALTVVLVSLRRVSLAARVRDSAGVFLLTSPVLYPWYATPLAVVSGWAPTTWAQCVLFVLPVSYEVIDGYTSGHGWSPAPWVVNVISLAATVGLAIDLLRRQRRKLKLQ